MKTIWIFLNYETDEIQVFTSKKKLINFLTATETELFEDSDCIDKIEHKDVSANQNAWTIEEHEIKIQQLRLA